MDPLRGGFGEQAGRGQRDKNPMASHNMEGVPQKVKTVNGKSFSDGTFAGAGHAGWLGELEGTRKAQGIEEGAQGMSVSEAFAAEAGVGGMGKRASFARGRSGE